MATRPTGCRLAAASARKECQNSHDLVREAVGYSGGLGGVDGHLLHGVIHVREVEDLESCFPVLRSGAVCKVYWRHR